MANTKDENSQEPLAIYLKRRTAEALQAVSDQKEVLWEGSTERKKYLKDVKIIAIFGIVLLLSGLIMLMLASVNDLPDLRLMIGGGLLMLGAVLGSFYASYQSSLHHRYKFERNYRLGIIGTLDKKDEELAANAVDGKLELPSLWANTQERLSTYHSIATDQAANSFRVGQRFAMGGFFVIIAAGIGAVLAPSAAGSIAAGAVGIVGAAMSSYIGSTFMKSQSEASAQLREFFNQPVEFSRVLSIERLIETLDEKDRPAAVQAVIRSMAPGASSLTKHSDE